MRNPIVPIFIVGILIAVLILTGQLTHFSFNFGGKSPTKANPTAVAAKPVEPPTQVPTPEPTATRQVIPPELQAQIDQIEQGAAELRGLQPLDDVPETFLTRAQFREQYKKEMQATLPLDQ